MWMRIPVAFVVAALLAAQAVAAALGVTAGVGVAAEPQALTL
jgi:hypothetical protein